jgi:hypothetical protein
MQRRTNTFQIAFARAIIKGFWDFVKLDEFPEGARDGSIRISKFWPFDEVTAIGNRLSSKPSLSERRRIQIEVMEREFIKEVRRINVTRDRALSNSGVVRDGDVQVISCTKQVVNRARDT